MEGTRSEVEEKLLKKGAGALKRENESSSSVEESCSVSKRKVRKNIRCQSTEVECSDQ